MFCYNNDAMMKQFIVSCKSVFLTFVTAMMIECNRIQEFFSNYVSRYALELKSPYHKGFDMRNSSLEVFKTMFPGHVSFEFFYGCENCLQVVKHELHQIVATDDSTNVEQLAIDHASSNYAEFLPCPQCHRSVRKQFQFKDLVIISVHSTLNDTPLDKIQTKFKHAGKEFELKFFINYIPGQNDHQLGHFTSYGRTSKRDFWSINDNGIEYKVQDESKEVVNPVMLAFGKL
jgi:hypothetical protein